MIFFFHLHLLIIIDVEKKMVKIFSSKLFKYLYTKILRILYFNIFKYIKYLKKAFQIKDLKEDITFAQNSLNYKFIQLRLTCKNLLKINK